MCLCCCVCALGGWCCLLGGGCARCLVGYWVVVLCLLARVCVSVWGVWLRVSGGRGCLGAGCVVAGGVLPSWLRGVVAGGGVSVGFDVGLRVFTLGGVSVPASGSSPAVSGPVSVSGSGVSVSPDAGVGASGSVVEDSASGGSVSSSDVAASSSGPVAGGVRVCVPCARAVFGDGWCFLVLRRWVRAAGVDGVKVDGLLGSGEGGVKVDGLLGSGEGGGSAASLCSPALVVASSPGVVPLSGSAAGSVSSVSVRSASVGGWRVGVGFGARVRDWGARVGVGGGVVSGGGVVVSWWAGWRSRVRALVSGVGVKGLVLAGLVFFVVLVSVLVLVG